MVRGYTLDIFLLPRMREKILFSCYYIFSFILKISNYMFYQNFIIYIFDSDLVWRMQVMITKSYKEPVSTSTRC